MKGKAWLKKMCYLLMIPKADSIFAAISHINTYNLTQPLLNIHSTLMLRRSRTRCRRHEAKQHENEGEKGEQHIKQ